MKHAKLSASASSRWLNCAGSILLHTALDMSEPENKSSPAAKEGTVAHGVAERMLLASEVSAAPYVGQTIDGGLVTEDMSEHVEAYVQYCRSHAHDDSLVLIENRVDFSHVVPEGFGTADFICITDDHMDIIDFKFGQGISVDAFENTQAQLYALGVLEEYSFYDIKSVTLHIHQPRKNNISSWDVTIDELTTFAKKAKAQAEKALTKNPLDNLCASEKACQWCPHITYCPELKRVTEEAICSQFDDVSDEIPLNIEIKLDLIASKAPLIRKYLEKVEEVVLSRCMDGETFDHVKLITGRSSTVWTDEAEDKLISMLGEDAYAKKLLSITATKNQLGGKKFKEELEPFTSKKEGKLKIVSRDAKGTEIKIENIIDNF